jgi:hypothetical protein
MHAAWPTHLIPLELIIPVIAGEKYKLEALHYAFSDPSVSLSLLGPDIILSTPFSQALNQCFPLMLGVTPNEHIKQNYSWVYFNLYVFL